MKIILSRKGFDSVSGGCPNPILPDGTLLSMPIPSNEAIRYADLAYDGHSYEDILLGLNPGKKYDRCHLDPDIRDGIRISPVKGWKAAFGQTGSAAGILHNSGVAAGDLFLFFGVFRQTEYDKDGILRFARGKRPIQIIYGYLQIGEILTQPDEIKEYFWNPHSDVQSYGKRNYLYIPSKKLSFLPDLPGYGVLAFREHRVLTMRGKSPAYWNEYEFLMPHNVMGNRKNNAKSEGLFYQGQWQELVLKPNPEAEKWAKQVIGDI